MHDMLEAASLIRRYMEGVSYEAFCENTEKQDAVSLRIAVLGETAGKIDAETAKALTTVPFKEITGMRNRISHDYGNIDFEVVWDVIQKDIGPLIAAFEAFLRLQ